MHGSLTQSGELAAQIAKSIPQGVDVAVCPPFVYLANVQAALHGSALALGAQNVSSWAESGAYTGEISGRMLLDFACRYVIVGHSERRGLMGESDETVAEKVERALAVGLIPIVCVGETLAQREDGETEAIVLGQLAAVIERCGVAALSQAVVAYEPVWAIGTGRTATPEQAQLVHQVLRGAVAAKDAKIADSLRILYGGSVKPDNAAELFGQPDIDGGLIGGAALDAEAFLAICHAAQAAT
jgi:triosephosphate isomerase